MTSQLHIAAQYLAAAGISFLKKREDDSHTNLGFSVEEGSLSSRGLNKAQETLSISYKNFTLDWNTFDYSESLELHGKTHKQVLKWIDELTTPTYLEGKYHYKLHYELPYKITDDYVFKLEDEARLRQLLGYRTLAQHTLERFLKERQLSAEVRVWPHHFDTGAYAALGDHSGKAVGIGMAIPDTIVDDYYFYISMYQGHEAVDVSAFAELSVGKWVSKGFSGAVLPIDGVDESSALRFLTEAFQYYTNS